MGRLGKPSNDVDANRAFGRQPDGTWHNGTDWGWGQGDGICAMADGVVSDISWSAGYGMTVTVDHGRLIAGKVTQTRYRHIDRNGVIVSLHEKVVRGTENIAVMGSSGTFAKGVKHLHTELLLDDVLADEQIYQKEHNVKPNARQIKPAPAKRREEPTTAKADNFDPTENFPGGAWVEWDGFVRSTMEGGQPDGDNIWLVKDGLYTAWTTTVPVPGDGALAGIPDLGVYPKIVLPTPTPGVSGATRAEVQAISDASDKKILAAINAIPKPPTAEAIASEVIRQMKLPGN